MRTLFISIILFTTFKVQSQNYPSFGSEIDVTINGLTFDAMEPFISANGNVLFFNNLNDGVNTKLYYATKINDSSFTFVGEVKGTNQITTPHLDAVADMDSLNNFYWTSTRDYPTPLENLFHGTFSVGNVTSIGRVYGNFNKNTLGWLVMDHGISLNGQYLYYNNARFDGVCQGPCETELGIAKKVNDSTFNQISNSNFILQHINDSNYIYYAPCISSDDLELYYTRYPKGSITASTLFEICVAVRNSPSDSFSIPSVLFSGLIPDIIEAPTLTVNKQIIYYHKKTASTHKIVMRYRNNTSGFESFSDSESAINIYPNPSHGKINIQTEFQYQKIKMTILNGLGEEVLVAKNQTQIDIRSLASGIYFLTIEMDGQTKTKKIFKIE